MAAAANYAGVPTDSAAAGVPFLRGVVEEYLQRHQYETALFWADKIVTITEGAEEDVYRCANVLYLTQQYHRVIGLIKRHNLDKENVPCILLMARCHFECREYSVVIEILNPLRRKPSLISSPAVPSYAGTAPRSIVSSMHLLCGRAYEAMDNQEQAADCFREALRLDALCYEAIDHLTSHHMLTTDEERDLLARLPIDEQICLAGGSAGALAKFLYEAKLNKYDTPGSFDVPEQLSYISKNADVLVSIAERYYYNCLFKKAYKITSSILDKDPYNEKCLPLHVALLVELKKPHELFTRAHQLVDHYPSKAISWFAVGCYYYATDKNELARRYLFKATSLDHYFGAAWIAFGHSFAAESEHDQATAAYSTASHVMKGCHLPLLYIGLEHGLASNGKLAEKFFVQALKAAPHDPFALHEVGVVEFQNERYGEAEARMLSALRVAERLSCEDADDESEAAAGAGSGGRANAGGCAGTVPSTWEPLLNNLGHVCRKLKHYGEAIDYHKRALALSPKSASTYSALGLCYMLCLQFAPALECLHKALSLHKEDTVSTGLLNAAVEEHMKDVGTVDDFRGDFHVPLMVRFESSLLHDSSADATGGGTPSSFAISSARLEASGRLDECVQATPNRSSIEDVSMDITPGGMS